MPQSIALALKRVAIVLAQELTYAGAAEKLNTTPVELQLQISALEEQLCLHIFYHKGNCVELTDEGRFLIKAFEEAAALNDRDADGRAGVSQK